MREAEDRLYGLAVLDLNLAGGLGFELFEYNYFDETLTDALRFDLGGLLHVGQ